MAEPEAQELEDKELGWGPGGLGASITPVGLNFLICRMGM